MYTNWRISDKPINISAGDVHIWLVDIENELIIKNIYRASYQKKSLERSARFVFEKDRNRHIITRGILRLLMSHYKPIKPKTIWFTTKRRGKPILDRAEHNHIKFNFDILFMQLLIT